MKSEDLFPIRPAARIINTLGRELIKDELAAIIELVKNSYDADSKWVRLEFDYNSDKEELKVVVEDGGHGMSRDVVVNHWLVPGTSNKLDKKESEGGRQLQGRKGIGRYAAGTLGQELYLMTVDKKGNRTSLLMNWNLISDKQYLDEVDVLVETVPSKNSSGTRIEVVNNLKKTEKKQTISDVWSYKKIKKLQVELRKLISPLENNKNDKFDINLLIKGFPSNIYSNQEITIEPLPLLDLFDYRVFGKISKTGVVKMVYENQCVTPVLKEEMKWKLENEIGDPCGELEFDIRVFDRDPMAIEELQKRTEDITGLAMGKQDVRRWLNSFNGIGIYKGGFRIRPYGDNEFDWLNLGSRRVDIPAKRIGSNQVIGLINIQPEELSGLEEKSARDGLVENEHYENLKSRVFSIIRPLEERRFEFRIKVGRGRRIVNINESLENLFDFDSVTNDIENKLKRLEVPESDISEIKRNIEKVKKEKAEQLEDIKESIAYYQNQANLGRMVGHILHEGRKPLSYIRNSMPYLKDSLSKILKKYDADEFEDELNEELEFTATEASKLYDLFSRLDPFTYKRSEKTKKNKLYSVVQDAIKLFEKELDENGIKVRNKISKSALVYGRTTELGWIFSNMIENSLYWLNTSEVSDKEITISANKKDDYYLIEYFDSGPGTTEDMLENGKMFEPGISRKRSGDGTGLGLAIVGELVKRNNGQVWAEQSNYLKFFLKLSFVK